MRNEEYGTAMQQELERGLQSFTGAFDHSPSSKLARAYQTDWSQVCLLCNRSTCP